MERIALIRRAASSILRAMKEVEGRHLYLEGPFTKVKPYTLRSPTIFEIEVEDLFIDSDGDSFAEAAAPTENAEDYKGPYHTVLVEAKFSNTTPEPSVGWAGGTELEDWEAIAIDGILLASDQDRESLSDAVMGFIPSYEDDWVQSWDEYQAEADIDD